MKNKKLSHIDPGGKAKMVDVGNKKVTHREAIAESYVILGDEIISEIKGDDLHTKKGPVFQTAIVAGTMAVKKTSGLIPMCHPLPIEKCSFDISREGSDRVRIQCSVGVEGKTGVEMEALTGAAIAALTIYDMCKAMSHHIEITGLKLVKKTGGKRDFII